MWDKNWGICPSWKCSQKSVNLAKQNVTSLSSYRDISVCQPFLWSKGFVSLQKCSKDAAENTNSVFQRNTVEAHRSIS